MLQRTIDYAASHQKNSPGSESLSRPPAACPSSTSIQATHWKPATLRRIRFGSIPSCVPLRIALTAFGSTRLVCFLLPHFCLPFSFSPAAAPAPAPAPAAFAASSPRTFEAAMNLNVRDKVCQPRCQLASMEIRRTMLRYYNFHSDAIHHSCSFHIPQTTRTGSTHPPPHHPPKPRTYSACTAVMPTRFSMSARCAFNCANCACRCVYCLLRLMVEAEAEVEG